MSEVLLPLVLLLLLIVVSALAFEEATAGARNKDPMNEMERRIGNNEENVTQKVIFETTP
jgi:hypothetical protein